MLNLNPTPAEWVASFNDLDHRAQLIVAGAVIDSCDAALACALQHSRPGSTGAEPVTLPEREILVGTFTAFSDAVDHMLGAGPCADWREFARAIKQASCLALKLLDAPAATS